VARYELALRTGVRFRRFRLDDDDQFIPETVVIRFKERDFVWHHIPDDIHGQHYAPGLSIVAFDNDDYRTALPELTERFLSALAFLLNQPIGVALYGGSGIIDPFAPPGPRERALFGGMISDPPGEIEVVDDHHLRLALGLYREGLNADSPFYSFLAFSNALEAAFQGNRGATDKFVNATSPQRRWRWPEEIPFPDDPAATLRESSRNAIAHVIRKPA
jgi:hypothetical protein